MNKLFTEKCTCSICNKQVSKINLKKHFDWHKRNPNILMRKEYISLNHEGLTCQYCGKVCKSRNSLAQHEIRCKQNPNRIMLDPSNGGGGWNKGLTKETDERVKKGSESLLKTYQNGYINPRKGKPGTFLGKHHTEKTKAKIRQAAIDNDLGGWNYNCDIEYKGIHLDSSYELAVAKSLDENKIKWLRPKKLFYVDKKGKKHYYFPDFYLPDYDVYLDPKNDYLLNSINKNFGYNDLDKIKWVSEQNKVRIIILDKNSLNWAIIKNKIV